jgi:hypothetical protein
MTASRRCMLAVMSFALLADHTEVLGFNGMFYATAATVIPVFFLALVVLGPAYRKVLHGIWIITGDVFPDLLHPTGRPPWPFSAENPGRMVVVTWAVVETVIRLLVALSLALVLAFGMAIIAAGGYGELLAVYALYQQHDQASTRLIVLVATMLLAILVVTGPLVTYLISAFVPASDDLRAPGNRCSVSRSSRVSPPICAC